MYVRSLAPLELLWQGTILVTESGPQILQYLLPCLYRKSLLILDLEKDFKASIFMVIKKTKQLYPLKKEKKEITKNGISEIRLDGYEKAKL